MDNQKIYEIQFVGQDYQPIAAAVKSAKIRHEGSEYFINEFGQMLIKDEKDQESDIVPCSEILYKFLEMAAPDGKCSQELLVVNSTDAGNKKLYDRNFGPKEDGGYFCGVVGVIRKQIRVVLKDDVETVFNVTLQIKSRLDVDENGMESRPYFLSTMLLRDKVNLSNNTIPSNEEEIFDYLLLFWFKEQLQKACLKGYYKTYRRFERNDDKVKGSIDIARHIRLNAGKKNGKIAYSYRENTINNYLNHLIVAAYYHLKNKYFELVEDNFDENLDLKKTIDFLSNEIGFSRDSKNELMNKNGKVIAHPFFTEYEQLRVICLKILRDEGLSIYDGELEQDTQGILFYLPELWEKFLEDEILNKGIPKDVTYEPQYPVPNFGYWQNGEYEFKQETYPDYVFFMEENPFMILDAKCKPKWDCVFTNGSVSKVMHDYNKCIRDMVAINAHATGVIFPTNNNTGIYDERILKHAISEYNNTDYFYTIPVHVPYVRTDDSYMKWKEQFQSGIAESAQVIQRILQSEKEFAEKKQEVMEQLKRKPGKSL